MAKKNASNNTDVQAPGVHEGWREKQTKKIADLKAQLGYEPVLERLYPLSKHILNMMASDPFFCAISRRIKKEPTLDMPTAAVGWKDETVTMWYNPVFLGDQSDAQCRGLIKHELYHVVLDHISYRMQEPHEIDNYAKDAAINCMTLGGQDGTHVDLEKCALPKGGIVPGQDLFIEPEVFATLDEKKKAAFLRLSALVKSWPSFKSSEWYFDSLKSFCEKEGEASGAGGGPEGVQAGMEACGISGPKRFVYVMDSHGEWGEGYEGADDLMREKIDQIIQGAVRDVEELNQGWGSIPSSVQKMIKDYYSRKVDWRGVLRQFFGTCQIGERSRSFHRIDRRLPMLYPGVKKSRVARILIAIDQSGSVADQLLSLFFAELSSMASRITFDVVFFDCTVDEESVFTWKKGTRVRPKRTRMGGTDFNTPTQFVNDDKRKGYYDGLLICTDGEAPQPTWSRVKRGWVIGPNNKLMFNTDELVVKIDDSKSKGGVC